ncbi:MAG: glycosyltransferase family 39 protein, partial [Anaerolineae bacterium]
MSRAIKRAFPFLLFLSALLPRAIYPVARSTVWHFRAIEFMDAVSQRDWAATLLAPHPGVTTMWLAGIARQLGSAFIGGFEGQLLSRQIGVELLPLALAVSLAIVAAYFLLRQIFDPQAAGASALLLALDPFHISISKTLHVDALMSVLAMLSALWMLAYVTSAGQHRWRNVALSGVLAGLALLSKTAALFLVPYLLLCLGVPKLDEWLQSRRRTGSSTPWSHDWPKAVGEVLRSVLLWALALTAIYFLLWPSMWVHPGDTLSLAYGETKRYTGTPHPRPLLFMGQTTLDDPGPLFYPVNLALKTTAVTFPCFFLGSAFLFSRKLNRRQRLGLFLAISFALFFTVQMTLAQKKDVRYN